MRLRLFFLLLSILSFAQQKEDALILLNKTREELVLNPESAEKNCQYLLQNYTDEKIRTEANTLLSVAKFSRNNITGAIEIIAKQHGKISPNSVLDFASILEFSGIDSSFFLGNTENKLYTDTKKMINSSSPENEINNIISDLKDLNVIQKQYSRNFTMYSLLNEIENSGNTALQKKIPEICGIYPKDIQFQIHKAAYYLKNNEEEKTRQTLQNIPEKQILESSNIFLKKEYYEMLALEFSLKNNTSEVQKIQQEFETVKNQINAEKIKARSQWFSIMENQNAEKTKLIINTGKKWFYSVIFLFCVLILIAGFRYYQLKKETNQLKIFQEKIKTLTEKTPYSISEKTENSLLKKLENFENGTSFLSSDISLQSMAKDLETNTKYLSETINTHKGKNFNGYINELRIRYILLKLKNDPVYRNYKIKYLSEETGFSSHSLFASVFKSVTGMPPNTYIKFLNETEK